MSCQMMHVLISSYRCFVAARILIQQSETHLQNKAPKARILPIGLDRLLNLEGRMHVPLCNCNCFSDAITTMISQ